MMFRKRLVCLSALYIAVCALSLGADLPMRLAPPAWDPGSVGRSLSSGGGGLAWGLAPGVGHLGAAGFCYYHAENCWSYRLVYDRFGNYLGEQPANICIELQRN
jgi:hypothetical protein